MPEIVQVQIPSVRRRVMFAITHRLGYRDDAALIAIERDGAGVIVHVNSGGNALAVEPVLRGAGYRVEEGPSADYGVKLRVLPGATS